MIRHKLKYLRSKYEMTQEDVAAKTNIDYRRYSRLERGEIEFTIYDAIRLQKVLKRKSINDLLEDEEL